MSSQAWALIAVPLLAAAAGLRLSRGASAAVAVGAGALDLVLAGVLALTVDGQVQTSFVIGPAGPVDITAGTLTDGLAATVAVMVCLVALLVQVYSVGYMRTDARYPAYAAEISLFTAAMLLVVLGADLLVLLVGWEVMGLCSYLLIGHYRDLPEAPRAAVKAFLVTRVGDVGFLLGVLVLGVAAQSFRITDVLAAVPDMSAATITTATLLLTLGVAGKSAQFPLHTWLPDAMAGPTPISALIHAATMVAAGVYVILRLYPAFVAAPVTLTVIGIIAAITMVLGALAALAQDDIKRVLAWSTVSQLAYMTGALAVGGYAAGAFHLLTHAGFKALLFLCAGAVLHVTGTALMSRMGGLRRSMPVTFAVMLVGSLALVGLVPFSGGFSKDSVLEAALHAAEGEAPVPVSATLGIVVFAAALATVALTAAYVTRMLLLTFAGPARAEGHPHDPEPLMRWPLLILAVPAALLGAAYAWVPGWIGVPADSLVPDPLTVVASLALIAIGSGTVLLGWRAGRLPAPAVLRRAFYLDDVQDAVVVRPVQRLARLVTAVDLRGVDGAVDATGRGTLLVGRALARQHPRVVQVAITGMVVGTLLLAVAVGVTA